VSTRPLRHLPGLLVVGLLTLGSAQLAAVETGDEQPGFAGATWLRDHAPDTDGALLVDLFASWLPNMADSVPPLGRLHRDYGERLQVVGLSRETVSELDAFRRRIGAVLNYPVGSAPERLFGAWRGEADALPHSILVDADGVVRWQGHPLDAAAAVRELLGKP